MRRVFVTFRQVKMCYTASRCKQTSCNAMSVYSGWFPSRVIIRYFFYGFYNFIIFFCKFLTIHLNKVGLGVDTTIPKTNYLTQG